MQKTFIKWPLLCIKWPPLCSSVVYYDVSVDLCSLGVKMLRIEIFLSIAVILWAFAFPRLGARWFGRVESSFSRFAQRRALSVAAVGILAVVARLAVLPVLPVPSPAIHDEFSYLLMADTFAHGRVANPTHPMWAHFETFHVNQVPAYVSKYYPAQGVFLAIGQVVFGHPFWGVLLSSALMCAAICWMLQGWMPPGWALLGGLLAVIRLGIFSYWANSYWGGAVAALGGALVLGALPRIKDKPQVRDTVWMGIGLALLLNSRPYESLFFATPIAIALLIWLLRRNEKPIQRKILRVIVPLGIILAVTAGAMAFYFWKTTGQPFQPPYLVYEATYSSRPAFSWMPLQPAPPYPSFARLNYYEGNLLGVFEFAVQHPFQKVLLRSFSFWLFYLGPTLTIPFLILLLALPVGAKVSDTPRALRLLSVTAAVSFAGLALPVVFFPHYAAPMTAAVYAFVLTAIKYIRPFFFGTRPVGLGATRAFVISCVLLAGVRIAVPIFGLALTPPKFASWAAVTPMFRERPVVASELNAREGSHLVFVAYHDESDKRPFDWVYNAADIDAAKIVWARDLGPAKNQELIDYYNLRKVWLIDPMELHPKLMAYPVISELHNPNRAATAGDNR